MWAPPTFSGCSVKDSIYTDWLSTRSHRQSHSCRTICLDGVTIQNMLYNNVPFSIYLDSLIGWNINTFKMVKTITQFVIGILIEYGFKSIYLYVSGWNLHHWNRRWSFVYALQTFSSFLYMSIISRGLVDTGNSVCNHPCDTSVLRRKVQCTVQSAKS